MLQPYLQFYFVRPDKIFLYDVQLHPSHHTYMCITQKYLMTVIFILLYVPFTVDIKYTCNKIEISTWRDYRLQLDLYLDINISCI